MDFGIDRLIDMIEQRIGKRTATAVLYVLTVSILIFGLKTIGSFLIRAFTYLRGLYFYFHGAALPRITPDQALSLLFDIVWVTIIWGIGCGGLLLIRRRIMRGTTEMLRNAELTVADCKEFTDKNHASLHEMLERLDHQREELVALREEVEANAKRVAGKAG